MNAAYISRAFVGFENWKYLEDALWNEDIKVLSTDGHQDKLDLREHILSLIAHCDVFIAILDGLTPNVMFELGFALACGKRILLLKGADAVEVPFSVASFPIMTIDQSDISSISSAITWIKNTKRQNPFLGLGSRLIEGLDQPDAPIDSDISPLARSDVYRHLSNAEVNTTSGDSPRRIRKRGRKGKDGAAGSGSLYRYFLMRYPAKNSLHDFGNSVGHGLLRLMIEDATFCHAVEPRIFEECVTNYLVEEGFQVQKPTSSPHYYDIGYDFKVLDFLPGKAAAIAAKKLSGNSKMSVSDVIRTVMAAAEAKMDYVIIITSGGFTSSAEWFARDSKDLRVSLLTISDLVDLSSDGIRKRCR